MKKVLVGFAAAALAAVMCVSFVACGGSDDMPDAEKIVSDKVTAEEWKAAFAEENFKNVEVKISEITERGLKEDTGWRKLTLNYTFSCNGANALVESSQSMETVNGVQRRDDGASYWVLQDGYIVHINQKDGKWVVDDKDREGAYGLTAYIGASFVYSFGYLYDSCTYSEETKGYVWKDEEGGEYILKFKKGKIATWIQICEEGNYKINSVVSFAYGGQKEVIVPEYSE